MAKDILEKFVDELLSGPGAANSDARKRARAAVAQDSQPENEATLADLAAHLDAAPDSGDDAAFTRKLAGDPDTLHEFESAQDFVDRVSSNDEPVPATLLRLAGAAPAPQRVVRLDAPSSRRAFLRRKPLLLWGGAIAAMIIAGVTGYAIRDILDRSQPQIASAPAPQPIANPSVAILPSDVPNNAAAPQIFGAVNPPVPISSHAVGPGDYPPESVQFQEQGTVKVKYLVLKNGTVATCQVEISSGIARLDDAACTLVRHWLFKPATMSDGSAAEWWLDASVAYQLRNPGLAPPPQPPATASAPAPGTGRVPIQNPALVKLFNEAQAAAKVQNWALALEKSKEADGIGDDKPAPLDPLMHRTIHLMIVSYAINAHDFATAMAQLEKNIAAGEGNRLNNVKQALSVAIAANNREKTDQYAGELGNSLDDQTRLSIATQVAQYGQVKEALDYAMPALQRLSDDQSLEIYRLRRVLGDLKSEEDYQAMAQEALIAGYSAEAKSVLDEAAAAKLLNGERAARLMKMASDRAAAERVAIADLQIKSATDPNAGIALGMHLWSTGNYASAEAAIRSAISHGTLAGLDRTKMALGHVLLSEGKIQEAITTFHSVRNLPIGDMIASLWAGYAATLSNSSGAAAVTGPLAPQTSVASARPPNNTAARLRPAIAQVLDEAQEAFAAKDFATALAKLREADSTAGKTPSEEYQVAKYLGFIAINQPMPDYPAAARAYNREVASGGVPQSEKAGMYNVAMRLNYQEKNYSEVIRDAAELQKLQPLDDTGYLVLIQSYYNTNDFAKAAATAIVLIAAKRASGMEPSKDLLALLEKSNAALKNSRPSSAPIATTSHAVMADDYPPVSIRLQEQGKVAVKYLVAENGTVTECAVIESSGKSRLDDAACTMVKRRWLFKPATRNGKPIAEYLTAEVVFQLK